MSKLSLLLIVLLLVGCENSTNFSSNKVKPDWKKTSHGVIYYVTCAEGFKFIATRSTHNKTQLAGPIGECDD